MKYYDLKKAKKLISENKANLFTASLGMHEDWFWTADTIYENGKFNKIVSGRKKTVEIGGITSSYWATPTLNLVFTDGSEKMIPCFYEENSEHDGKKKPEFLTLGVLSGPVQDNITPLTE